MSEQNALGQEFERSCQFEPFSDISISFLSVPRFGRIDMAGEGLIPC